MDDQQFKDTVERLQQVNAVIGKLDPAIRSEAFGVLRPYVEGKPGSPSKQSTGEGDDEASGIGGGQDVDISSAEAFVRSQDIDKPANAVKAIAAWWFSQYGSVPIRAADIKKLAGEIGVTIPDKPYMTLTGMKTDGKDVFRSSKGDFVPTVPHGELFFQSQYKVKKGKQLPPSPDPK